MRAFLTLVALSILNANAELAKWYDDAKFVALVSKNASSKVVLKSDQERPQFYAEQLKRHDYPYLLFIRVLEKPTELRISRFRIENGQVSYITNGGEKKKVPLKDIIVKSPDARDFFEAIGRATE